MEGKGQGFLADFKRPKVNAIREFPEGCGPYAFRVEDLHEVTQDSASHFRVSACADNSSIPVLRSLENSPNTCPPKILEPYNSCLNRVDENKEDIRLLNVVYTDKSLTYQDQNHINWTKSVEIVPRKCDPKMAKVCCMNCDDEKVEVLRSSHSDVVHTRIRAVENGGNIDDSLKRIKSYHPNGMNYNDMNYEAENGEILGSSNSGRKCTNFNAHREKVIQVLKMNEKLTAYLMVLRRKELESKKQVGMASVYFEAAMLLKKQNKWINTSKLIGSIHGVEIGDKFLSRAELNVIGMHQQFQAGIDYMKKDGKVIATSIVASGKYFDDVGSSDTMLYSGHGGNPAVGKAEVRDQRLERGNLALKNSKETKSVVRVIKGIQVLRTSTGEEESECNFRYIYDGLYFVDDCKIERGNFGKLVFKFLLKRVSGQQKLTW